MMTKTFLDNTETLTFPKDHGAHATKMEWWYVSSKLSQNTHPDQLYWLSFAIFRFRLPIPILKYFVKETASLHYRYQAHVTFVDLYSQRYYKHTFAFNLPGAIKASTKELHLTSKEFTFSKVNDKSILYFKTDFLDTTLTLSDAHPVVFHGESGLISMSDTGSSYYYSKPNLKTEGELTYNSKTFQVSGSSWLDHQWGNWHIRKCFWHWYAISLDNGMQIMLYLFLKENQLTKSYSTLVYQNGTTEALTVLNVKREKSWISPESGISYPTEVTFMLGGSFSLELTVKADFDDQEFSNRLFHYWEGFCSVKGKIDNSPVTGYATAELVNDYRF